MSTPLTVLEMTSPSRHSCLSLTTRSSFGRWVTKAFRSNLPPSCTLMQGFWKDHLKPFCTSLSLSNGKINLTLLCSLAGTGEEDVPCETHGEGEPPVPCSYPTWRWHPLGSLFLGAPQAGLWPGFKSTAQTHESCCSALTERCTIGALFLFMWCQVFRDGSFKNSVHV